MLVKRANSEVKSSAFEYCLGPMNASEYLWMVEEAKKKSSTTITVNILDKRLGAISDIFVIYLVGQFFSTMAVC